VAASFSTPTLFLIAENLSRMEILTEVDESDIGDIKEGQSVRFEVQTYSDEIFEGTVRQVRLQPTTISNVVTYTVVVDAKNEEGLLLPGMTATVDFITESRENVLTVPNTALRFTPLEDVMQEAFEKRRAERGDNRGDGGDAPPGRPMMLQMDRSEMKESMGQVWYLDNSGELAMAMFRKGISDGTDTEILMSRDLSEGMEIISGYESGSGSTTSSETSDRKMSPVMGGGPPPRGF
jgi:HlyD family secretion protein